jgi:plastocyanin
LRGVRVRPSCPTRLILLGVLAALLAVPTFASAGGGPQPVVFKDNQFVPAISPETTAPQSTINWNREAGSVGSHNIRQDDKLFRSGNPSASFSSYSRRPSAGTFHYYCENHGSPTSGMQGKLRVTPVVGRGFPDSTFKVLWASADTNTGSAFDVRFRVPGGEWRNWRNDTTKFSGHFGRNDRPVAVVPGAEYDFQVRSEKASNPAKRSNWSPPYEIFSPS